MKNIFLITTLLSFVYSDITLGSQCAPYDVNEAFSGNDVTVLVENIGLAMNRDEFIYFNRMRKTSDSSSDPIKDGDASKAWDDYVENDSFSYFIVRHVFKGGEKPSSIIRVYDSPESLIRFEINKRYILFLEDLPKNDSAYYIDECLVFNLTDEKIDRGRAYLVPGKFPEPPFNTLLNYLIALSQESKNK